jgi:hypothetical protein
MLCRHVQSQLESLDWRNIAKHQTRHGKQKKTKKQHQKTPSTNSAKEEDKQQEKNKNKNTKTEHEKNKKKNETIKIHNPGLWLVKHLIKQQFV